MMPDDGQIEPPELKFKAVDIEAEEIKSFQVPSFVNYVNVWHYGHDVYLDMALATIEQMAALKPGSEVTVAMYDRFVMSPATFDDLVGRMNLVREQLKAQGLVQDGTIDTPKAR